MVSRFSLTNMIIINGGLWNITNKSFTKFKYMVFPSKFIVARIDMVISVLYGGITEEIIDSISNAYPRLKKLLQPKVGTTGSFSAFYGLAGGRIRPVSLDKPLMDLDMNLMYGHLELNF